MPYKDGVKSQSTPIASNNNISTLSADSTIIVSRASSSEKTTKPTYTKLQPSGPKMSSKPVDTPEAADEELLGSLTTYNVSGGGEAGGPAVRTSARVIKKMKLDSGAAVPSQCGGEVSANTQRKDSLRGDGDKIEETITASKISTEKQTISKSKIVKRRTPKALWSANEKNLFFEALNEYGKDFDAITAYIFNKMKRKGVPDAATKAKHQVSTFYYRTWQKVSKHIKFSDNVKKVVQELYALINYGEMRKRLESGITSKMAGRLPELVTKGVVAVRARGRTLRVRTPVCRALRRLNHLDDWDEQVRLPARVLVVLSARDCKAWARVQGAAHNPRALAPAPPSLRLQLLVRLLQRRWRVPETAESTNARRKNSFRAYNTLDSQINLLSNPGLQTLLRLEDDTSTLTQLHNLKNSVGNLAEKPTDAANKKDPKTNSTGCTKGEEPSPTSDENAQRNIINNVPSNCKDNETVEDNAEESSKTANLDNTDKVDELKNCSRASSQIEIIPNQKMFETVYKSFQKKTEWDDKQHQQETDETGKKKLYLHVGPKPGVNLNFPTINVSEHVTSQRICLMSYQERLGANSVSHANGLQNGVGFKGGGGRFKSQKRHRKDSGDLESISKKGKPETDNCDIKTDIFDIDETANDGMDMMEFKMDNALVMPCDEDDKDFEKDKDFLSELEDDDKYNNETDGENDLKIRDQNDDLKNPSIDRFPGLKTKLNERTKKERTQLGQLSSLMDSPEEGTGRVAGVVPELSGKTWNRDIVLQQIKKGWSVYDAADLTVGDLYLMFGNESKLQLEYWWSEASSPIPSSTIQQMKQVVESSVEGLESALPKEPPVSSCGPGTFSSEEGEGDRVTDVEALLMSPTHNMSQDSNDTEKEMMSPDHRIPHVPEEAPTGSGFPLVSKIVNCPSGGLNQVSPGGSDPRSPEHRDSFPQVVPSRDRIVSVGARLKKLLSLTKMYNSRGKVGCSCGHFCSSSRVKRNLIGVKDDLPTRTTISDSQWKGVVSMNKEVFRSPSIRHPLLKTTGAVQKPISSVTDFGLEKLPPWTRRGRAKPLSPVPAKISPILPRPVPQMVPLKVSASSVFSSPSVSTTATAPAPLLRVLPALRPKPSIVIARSALERPSTSTFVLNETLSIKQSDTNGDPAKQPSTPASLAEIVTEKVESLVPPAENEKQTSIYTTVSDSPTKSAWEPVGGELTKSDLKDVTPNLANLLDISLPSNIGDDNSLGINLKTDKNGSPEKHDNFTGLLQAESMSMSPSRLLKENDDQWLESEVHNFSLSSFLGHLEAPPSASAPSNKCELSAKGGDESVDTHLQCLMSETSIDYMAKFEDLAKRVSAEATK